MPRDDPIPAELARVVGHPVDVWTSEPLVHNKANSVTGSIERIATPGWSGVLKVLQAGDESAPSQWRASDAPTHWNYWRREALVYESDLPALFADGGIDGPLLLGSFRRSEREIALWLEDVDGLPGKDWSVDRYARMARSLGVAQGRFAVDGPPSQPWLTRGFLRDYSGSRPADWTLLDDDRAWDRPLVRDHFPAGLRPRMVRMHAERERWLALMESLPRTLCHLDVWPHNLLARDHERSVLVDWAFVGDGALGEDVGNLVPDCVFDLFISASSLAELDERAFRAYADGLKEGGWRGDERLVRLAICASAIKYDWLTPLMLERATLATQVDYGGEQPIAAELRYRERGRTLAFLAGWLDEARTLADELGL